MAFQASGRLFDKEVFDSCQEYSTKPGLCRLGNPKYAGTKKTGSGFAACLDWMFSAFEGLAAGGYQRAQSNLVYAQ